LKKGTSQYPDASSEDEGASPRAVRVVLPCPTPCGAFPQPPRGEEYRERTNAFALDCLLPRRLRSSEAWMYVCGVSATFGDRSGGNTAAVSLARTVRPSEDEGADPIDGAAELRSHFRLWLRRRWGSRAAFGLERFVSDSTCASRDAVLSCVMARTNVPTSEDVDDLLSWYLPPLLRLAAGTNRSALISEMTPCGAAFS